MQRYTTLRGEGCSDLDSIIYFQPGIPIPIIEEQRRKRERPGNRIPLYAPNKRPIDGDWSEFKEDKEPRGHTTIDDKVITEVDITI